MIHYKLKKKDYISPHLEVTWIEEDDSVMGWSKGVTGEGSNMPAEGEWGAKSSGVTHFDSDLDFEDDFEDNSSSVYESYKVEW